MPGERGPAGRGAAGPWPTRRCSTTDAEAEVGALIEAVTRAARAGATGRRAGRARRSAARSPPRATTTCATTSARLARFELGGRRADGDEPSPTVPIPGGAVEVLPSEAFDAEARRAPARGARASSAARSSARESKLANEGFVAKAPAEVVEEERGKLERATARRCEARGAVTFRAGRGVPALARAVRHAVRARAHAPADDRARAAAARASRRSTWSAPTASPRPSRSCAALLERHGAAHRAATSRRTCARSRSGSRSARSRSPEADFAAAVERAAAGGGRWSTARADADDRVTQFEALTAAAFHELGAARGGGGGDRGRARRALRRDQRDPLAGRRCSPTSASSTRAGSGPTSRTSPRRSWPWCATTATLVVGALAAGGPRDRGSGRPPSATPRWSRAESVDHAAARRRRLPARELRACAAAAPRRSSARSARRRGGRASRSARDGASRAGWSMVGEDPLDALRRRPQPSGRRRARRALAEVLGERRPRVAVIGVLEDKDAAGMLGTLAAAASTEWCSPVRPTRARSRPPRSRRLAEQLGGPPAETVAEPRAAVARARELAGTDGRGARDRLDLPDRRPRARGRRRAGVDALVRRVSAVLFDLDGVLVESRESTERVWLAWASKNGIDEGALRSAMHGVRSAEVVRALRPDLDAAAESDEIERRQAEDVEGLVAIPGAAGGSWGIEGSIAWPWSPRGRGRWRSRAWPPRGSSRRR